jgi:hypothetical protein
MKGCRSRQQALPRGFCVPRELQLLLSKHSPHSYIQGKDFQLQQTTVQSANHEVFAHPLETALYAFWRFRVLVIADGAKVAEDLVV